MQVALLTELPLRIFRIARAVKGKKKNKQTHIQKEIISCRNEPLERSTVQVR